MSAAGLFGCGPDVHNVTDVLNLNLWQVVPSGVPISQIRIVARFSPIRNHPHVLDHFLVLFDVEECRVDDKWVEAIAVTSRYQSFITSSCCETPESDRRLA